MGLIKPDIPASKVYTELLGQGFTQGGFAGARRPMKQHYSVPADQLVVHMPVSKQQGTEGILQQARLDLCVIDQALPQPMELSRWQLPFSAGATHVGYSAVSAIVSKTGTRHVSSWAHSCHVH